MIAREILLYGNLWIIFAIFFAKKIVIGIEIIDEIRIVVKIVSKFVVDIWVICEMAAAIPVLCFWNR